MYSLNLQGEDPALPGVRARVAETLRAWREGLGKELKKVLLVPPDFTRYHSGAGVITQLLYGMLARLNHAGPRHPPALEQTEGLRCSRRRRTFLRPWLA